MRILWFWKFPILHLIVKFNLLYDYYPFKVPRQGRFCSVLVTNLTNCQWTTVGQDLGSRKIKPAVRRKTEQIGMFLLLGEPGSDHQISHQHVLRLIYVKVFLLISESAMFGLHAWPIFLLSFINHFSNV